MQELIHLCLWPLQPSVNVGNKVSLTKNPIHPIIVGIFLVSGNWIKNGSDQMGKRCPLKIKGHGHGGGTCQCDKGSAYQVQNKKVAGSDSSSPSIGSCPVNWYMHRNPEEFTSGFHNMSTKWKKRSQMWYVLGFGKPLHFGQGCFSASPSQSTLGGGCRWLALRPFDKITTTANFNPADKVSISLGS